MTLLAPMAALIAGAIGAAGILVAYSLKLRRRPVRVSAAWLWEQAASDMQGNVPLRLPRPSWLLLAQLVILTLLALAFGRPVLSAGDGAGRVVVVLDRSASMSAADMPEGATRFDAARERSEKVIRDSLSRGSEVVLVSWAGSARVAAGPTTSRSVLLGALDALDTTDQPNDTASLMQTLRALDTRASDDEESDGAGLDTAFVIVTDANVPDPGSFRPFAPHIETIGPTGPASNVGIVSLAARRDESQPSVVRVFAGLINSGPTEAMRSVAVLLDDTVVERRAVRVPGSVDEEPGRAGVSFEVVSAGGALLTVGLQGDDALKSDDSASVLLVSPVRRPALIVHPTGARGGSWIIAAILEELRVPRVDLADAEQYLARLAGGSAAGYGLIVFDRVTPTALAPGVPTISFGAGLPTLGVALEAITSPIREAFATWRRDHVLLRDVSLESVVVDAGARIGFDRRDPRVEPLADLESGPGIVLVSSGDARHLVVSFTPEQTTWTATAGFSIFLAGAVDELTGRATAVAGRSATTGEPVMVRADPGARTIRITGPRERELAVVDSEGVQIGTLDRAGVYTLEGATPGVLPVNLVDDAESSLAPASLSTGAARATLVGAVGGRPIWKWLVLAAVGVLALEWFWFAHRAKR